MHNITGSMVGIKSYNSAEKAAQHDMMIRNPAKIPRLNGKDFLKPYFPALDMDMMLLGPGVKAVRKMYEKNAAKFIVNTSNAISDLQEKTCFCFVHVLSYHQRTVLYN